MTTTLPPDASIRILLTRVRSSHVIITLPINILKRRCHIASRQTHISSVYKKCTLQFVDTLVDHNLYTSLKPNSRKTRPTRLLLPSVPLPVGYGVGSTICFVSEMKLFLIILSFRVFVFAADPSTRIVLPQGILTGVRMQTERRVVVTAYLGIPYALPPLGPYRFAVSLANL